MQCAISCMLGLPCSCLPDNRWLLRPLLLLLAASWGIYSLYSSSCVPSISVSQRSGIQTGQRCIILLFHLWVLLAIPFLLIPRGRGRLRNVPTPLVIPLSL